MKINMAVKLDLKKVKLKTHTMGIWCRMLNLKRRLQRFLWSPSIYHIEEIIPMISSRSKTTFVKTPKCFSTRTQTPKTPIHLYMKNTTPK